MGGLHNKNYFYIVLEARSTISRNQHGQFLLRMLFPCWMAIHLLCPHIVIKESTCSLILLLIRALTHYVVPTLMTSSTQITFQRPHHQMPSLWDLEQTQFSLQYQVWIYLNITYLEFSELSGCADSLYQIWKVFSIIFPNVLSVLFLLLLLCIDVPQTSKMLFIFLCYFSFCFSEWISLINFILVDSSTCSNSFCCFLFFLLLSPASELFISLILLFKLRISICFFLKKIIYF